MIPGILFRYLMISYLTRFGIVIAIIITVLLVSNSFDTLNRFKSAILTLPVFFSLISLKLPYLLSETMTITVFVSALFFLNYLSRTEQLVSIWSTGTSVWRVILPILFSAFLIGIVTTTLLQPLASTLLNKYEKKEAKIHKLKLNAAAFANSGVMLAEDYNDEKRIFIVRSADLKENKLHGVTILFIGNNNNFINRIDAEFAYLKNNEITLHNFRSYNEQNSSNRKITDAASYSTNITIDRFTKIIATPEHISFWKMPQLILELQQAGMPALNYQIYYYKQMYKPLLMIGICLMAFCFTGSKKNRVINTKTFIVAIIFGFIVYLANEIITTALVRQDCDIVLACLCPILIIILLSVLTILHLHETG